ncbi:unnamed protein product [Prunus armeniaca]
MGLWIFIVDTACVKWVIWALTARSADMSVEGTLADATFYPRVRPLLVADFGINRSPLSFCLRKDSHQGLVSVFGPCELPIIADSSVLIARHHSAHW